MTILFAGVMLGLAIVGDPVDRDMGILIIAVALSADWVRVRLPKERSDAS